MSKHLVHSTYKLSASTQSAKAEEIQKIVRTLSHVIYFLLDKALLISEEGISVIYPYLWAHSNSYSISQDINTLEHQLS